MRLFAQIILIDPFGWARAAFVPQPKLDLLRTPPFRPILRAIADEHWLVSLRGWCRICCCRPVPCVGLAGSGSPCRPAFRASSRLTVPWLIPSAWLISAWSYPRTQA